MRGSGKNARMERKLEEAIEALVVSYTGYKDEEKALMNSTAMAKEVAQVTCEIACAIVVARECGKMGHHKRYEARYFISEKGINGNLVRSWEVPELPEDAEEKSSPPSRKSLIFPLIWLRLSCWLSVSLRYSITDAAIRR
jgi:hypothetical protein